MLGHVHPDFEGRPSARHEAACASGSMAILAGMSDILAGHYGLVGVVGVEMMRNVPGQTAAENLGAAAWVGREAQGARYVWPAMFSDLAEEYERRYGLDASWLSEISRKNFANAKRNPLAQSRNWTHTDASFSRTDDEANPVVEGRMRRSDCGQVTDGAAVIFLASRERAAAWAKQHQVPLESIPRIKGWGQTTAPLLMQTKLEQSAGESGYVFPWVRRAILDAYRRAGIAGPEQLDGIETHDCFSITEYMALEHFGLTAPGEGWKAVEDGRIQFGGSLPVNASGGLIGLGHPVGATGVRMVFDAWRQTAGQAGEMQIAGARTMAHLQRRWLRHGQCFLHYWHLTQYCGTWSWHNGPMVKPAYIQANSVTLALEVMGDRWVLMLLQQALFGVQTFDDFQRRLDLARGTLSSRLRHMVQHGLFDRVPAGPDARRHIYILTEKGQDLFHTGLMMDAWQRAWAPPDAPMMHIQHKSCGARLEPELRCGDCHSVIDPRQVSFRDGPGASLIPRETRRRRRSSVDNAMPPRIPVSPELLEVLVTAGHRRSLQRPSSAYGALKISEPRCNWPAIS
jgi:acetyl-CoA C-acetyltransferase